MIEFVTASHRQDVLSNNLLQSPILEKYPLTIMRDFQNVAEAYNQAELHGREFVVYVHHDVYLPESFEVELLRSLLKLVHVNWGVLGVAGVDLRHGNRRIFGHIEDRGSQWGMKQNLPHQVDTLDELMLITKGRGQFDPQFDQHFYGADLCLQAKLAGQTCHAIDAFCHHNSTLQPGFRSQSFRKCEVLFRAKYIDHLPIATTCTVIR